MTTATDLTAASSRSVATVIFNLGFFFTYYSIILFALSAFVPVSLQTNGSFKSTSSAALMIPVAIVSHFIIPPNMLMRMAFTFGCELKISKAVLTCSTLAPPPTSKKFAGYPPFNLIISMVAIASPAPLTMHPILPSRAT